MIFTWSLSKIQNLTPPWIFWMRIWKICILTGSPDDNTDLVHAPKYISWRIWFTSEMFPRWHSWLVEELGGLLLSYFWCFNFQVTFFWASRKLINCSCVRISLSFFHPTCLYLSFPVHPPESKVAEESCQCPWVDEGGRGQGAALQAEGAISPAFSVCPHGFSSALWKSLSGI